MFIPPRLSSFLLAQNAEYEVQRHRRTRGSSDTAHAAHVPPHQLAKAVVLEDDIGCVMAVVPADRYVRLGRVSQVLKRQHLHLADEDRIATLFPDCERGAVPALGMVWGLETVVDDELDDLSVVYIECGDHEGLLRLEQRQFHALMRQARHGPFSGLRLH
jgi:Ala-tRNA(Pro) deacylase